MFYSDSDYWLSCPSLDASAQTQAGSNLTRLNTRINVNWVSWTADRSCIKRLQTSLVNLQMMWCHSWDNTLSPKERQFSLQVNIIESRGWFKIKMWHFLICSLLGWLLHIKSQINGTWWRHLSKWHRKLFTKYAICIRSDKLKICTYVFCWKICTSPKILQISTISCWSRYIHMHNIVCNCDLGVTGQHWLSRGEWITPWCYGNWYAIVVLVGFVVSFILYYGNYCCYGSF